MANLRERGPREEEGGLDGAPDANSSCWEGNWQRHLLKRGLGGGRGTSETMEVNEERGHEGRGSGQQGGVLSRGQAR